MKAWLAFLGLFALCSACSADSASGVAGGTGGKGGGGGSGATGGGQAGDASTDGSPDGASCAADEIPCNGVCVVTSSCTFAVTSLEPPNGWQNGRGWVKLHGAGFAKGVGVTIGSGVAPARVIDPSTILIETPPGPVGQHDVTVKLGAQTATLKAGFTYKSAGLTPPWQQRGLTIGRGNGPAVALLQDGRVLIAGGTSGLSYDTAIDSADIYTEPQASAVAASGKMSTQRFIASAVTLLTGKVIVVGGTCQLSTATPPCLGNPKAIDLFDPATNTFTASAASLPENWVATQGVLLADGRALFITNSVPKAAIYDPDTDAIKVVPVPLPGPYGMDYAFTVRLRDGRVLVGAGDLAGIGAPGSYNFIFDPVNDTFTATGAFAKLRSGPVANTLPDGRVLVVGGADPNNGYVSMDSMELYDPASGTFSLAPYKLSVPRLGHAAVLVRDGTVLAIAGDESGGIKDCTTPGVWTETVDQIDPVAGTVTTFAPLAEPVVGLTGVVMTDGSVLVAGGAQCGVAPVPKVDFMQGAKVN